MHESKYTLLRDKYLEELSHLANETKKGYRTVINNFGKFIEYKDVFDKQDIIDYLNSEGFQSLEVSSQNSYKAKLKAFLFWIGFQKKDILSILRKKNEIKKVLNKSDLLTKEEIQQILIRMRKPIHKALFMLTLETKARKKEIITLKIKDVVFYDSHAMVYIRESKTAQRNIPIVESIPYLTRYLEDHPLLEDQEAPFFVTLYRGEYRPYSINAFNGILKKNTSFLNKRIYPHLLRHTGLTEMAKHMTEFQLKQLAGWTMDSKQAARYVHLADDDIENKILELHGIIPPKDKEDVKHIEIIRCPRCEYANSNLDKFCSRCGSALSVKIIMEHRAEAKEIEELIEKSDFKKYIDELFEKKFQDLKIR